MTRPLSLVPLLAVLALSAGEPAATPAPAPVAANDAQKTELEAKRDALHQKEQDARKAVDQAPTVVAAQQQVVAAKAALKHAQTNDPALIAAHDAVITAKAELAKATAAVAAKDPAILAAQATLVDSDRQRGELAFALAKLDLQLDHHGGPARRSIAADPAIAAAAAALKTAETAAKSAPALAAVRTAAAAAAAKVGTASGAAHASTAGQQLASAQTKAKAAGKSRAETVTAARQALNAAREKAQAKLAPDVVKAEAAAEAEHTAAQAKAKALGLVNDALREAASGAAVDKARTALKSATEAFEKAQNDGSTAKLAAVYAKERAAYDETFKKLLGNHAEYNALNAKLAAAEQVVAKAKAQVAALSATSPTAFAGAAQEIAAALTEQRTIEQQRRAIRMGQPELDLHYHSRGSAQSALKQASDADPAVSAADDKVDAARKALDDAIDAALASDARWTAFQAARNQANAAAADAEFRLALVRLPLTHRESPLVDQVEADAGVVSAKAALDKVDDPTPAEVAAAAEVEAANTALAADPALVKAQAEHRTADAALKAAEKENPAVQAVPAAREALAKATAAALAASPVAKPINEERLGILAKLDALKANDAKVRGEAAAAEKKLASSTDPAVTAARDALAKAEAKVADAAKGGTIAPAQAAVATAEKAVAEARAKALAEDATIKDLSAQITAINKQLADLKKAEKKDAKPKDEPKAKDDKAKDDAKPAAPAK